MIHKDTVVVMANSNQWAAKKQLEDSTTRQPLPQGEQVVIAGAPKHSPGQCLTSEINPVPIGMLFQTSEQKPQGRAWYHTNLQEEAITAWL